MTGPAKLDPLAGHVARLFFDRQLSKVEIGQRLGISRFRVARLIDRARADGMVHIEFRDAVGQDPALGRALEERFGLDLCVVAEDAPAPADGSPGAHESERLDRVAALAAATANDLIGAGDVIGIAWGSTLAAFARSMPQRSPTRISVVQLAGSSRHLERDREPREVSRVLADRLAARHHALFAPAFVESPALRDALIRQPELSETVEAFGRLTLAIVGVGTFETAGGVARSSLLQSGALTDEEIQRLRSLGAVGDLVVHAFDAEGRFVATDLSERAIAIDVGQLRRTRVLAVAAGAAKATAIRGAVATGVVRMLVTDAEAARAVLDRDRAGDHLRLDGARDHRALDAGDTNRAVTSARGSGQ